MKRALTHLLVFAPLSLACICQAQDDPEKAELKRQIEELKQAQKEMQQKFDSRISELEKKLESRSQPKTESNPVKIEALVQSRADFDSGANDSFYLRRTELKFSGKITPKIGWAVMIDPAKELKLTNGASVNQASRILQDAFISLDMGGNWTLDVGQKKIPISYEGLMPTYALDTLERALFSSQGKLADVRDIGIQATGKWKQVEVTAAVLNGTGESQNTKDPNDQKTFGGRVIVKPNVAPGLQVGASALSGTGPSGTSTERRGLEAVWKRNGLTVRSELVTGLDSNVRSQGSYAHIGYQFAPRWESLLRFDTFDPNRDLGNDEVSDAVLGLNYYIQDHNAKLQFNWVNRKFGNGSRRTIWQFGLQTKW